MSIALDTQCLECHFRRSLETARAHGDEKTALAFAKELMKLYVAVPEGVASPWFGPDTAALLEKFYGIPRDRYREEKAQSNRFVMSRLEKIRAMVEKEDDRLLAALKFSILGNYLDFSALQGEVSFDQLDEMLAQGLSMELDMAVYQRLQTDLKKGKKLLYLTDNAGEIVFDRILAEEIQRHYPELTITFCVRGGPAHNDATREDAALVGIPFPVIDNGNTVGGTELSLLSPEAREAMERADVILAKGMGNTETLYGSGYPVYYAFLVKCPRFEAVFKKPMLTPMLVRE